jgi:Domain of unknown function (DUF4105)
MNQDRQTASPPTTSVETPPAIARRSWVSSVFRWLWVGLRCFVQVLFVLWATLALYYSNLPWPWARVVLAVAFVAFSIWALWLTRKPRMGWAFAAVFLGVLVWFICIPPSHDRPWRREVAVMPRAIIDGDRVRLTGVRNFEYRSRNDFTEHLEEREVSISHLTSVDFFVSYWRIGPVGHTFLSFNFDNAPPVCISIETRPEVGEGFAPIASMFKQFELIYVVGDEHDLVGSRVNHRGEETFMYPIRTTPEAARRLFLVYLDRINQLADRPEFYHLLSNSCTINIIRYANVAGRVGRFELDHLLNGFIDRYLYRSGRIDTTLPFEELRRRSHINEAVRAAADAPDFSQRIRASLPPKGPAPSPVPPS